MGDLLYTKFHHIGVVVKDLEKAIKYCESLGMGPFKPLVTPNIPGKIIESTVYGKPHDVQCKIVSTHMGPVEFELIEPIKGKAPLQEDFLRRKGEGVQHLGFKVENLEEVAAEFKKKGFKPVQARVRSSGYGGLYFDTEKECGVMIEIWNPPKE